jgi:hypothetical protein
MLRSWSSKQALQRLLQTAALATAPQGSRVGAMVQPSSTPGDALLQGCQTCTTKGWLLHHLLLALPCVSTVQPFLLVSLATPEGW